jgi:hypothetical protein
VNVKVETIRSSIENRVIDITYDRFYSGEPLGTGFYYDDVLIKVNITGVSNPLVKQGIITSFQQVICEVMSIKDELELEGRYVFRCGGDFDDLYTAYPHQIEDTLKGLITDITPGLDKVNIPYQIEVKLSFATL